MFECCRLKLADMKLDKAALKQLVPSYLLVFVGIAIAVIYYGISFKEEFASKGEESYSSIRSLTFSNCLFLCCGGSAALLFNSIADCIGKYILKDTIDAKYVAELSLILSIFLPSICMITNMDDMNAISFFWVLFHVQVLVILNVTFVFWAEKMSLGMQSRELLINSALSVATFVAHIFTAGPSWTATSDDVANVIYMCLFCAQVAYLFVCCRQTRNKADIRNAAVLIDTAAVEQQWAMCVIILICLYYLAFLILEAGVFPGQDDLSLTPAYLCAQYGLLSVFALIILTLHQRKEMYHGVMSQASLDIKRLFVRYVSHEIRTPLNTTLLGLNLLEADIRDGVEDHAVLIELVRDATSSCTIAIGILNDLLMYEKIDGGLLTLERAETAVWPFVESVLKVFLIQAKSSNVELSWPRRCVKGVHAEIDVYKLSQVLRNLVSNALKFTPSGGTVTIMAEVLTPGAKPRNVRSLSSLKETDESAAEELDVGQADGAARGGNGGGRGAAAVGVSGSGSGSGTGSAAAPRYLGGRRAKRGVPAAKSKSIDFDDMSMANNVIGRSVSTEETPPHVYAVPNLSPKACMYNARGVLVPDISNATLTTGMGANSSSAAPSIDLGSGTQPSAAPSIDFSARAAGGSLAAGTMTAYPSMDFATLSAVAAASRVAAAGDLESGMRASVQADEGTAKLTGVGVATGGALTTPGPAAAEGDDRHHSQPHHPGLATTSYDESPKSSNESSPPEKTTKPLSDTSMNFVRKLFSADQDRSNMQIFPTTNMVRISVTDSGAGISKENQERLFKEIVQFNAGKLQNGQGSGIGLWISNTIVKLHGGKIGVISEGEGGGSTFYIDIPISKIERGSNYKHVSPAHLDVSSKNKYNSPASSPDNRSRQARLSAPASPTIRNAPTPLHQHPHNNATRNFISPESERTYRSTLAPMAEHGGGGHSPLRGLTLASVSQLREPGGNAAPSATAPIAAADGAGEADNGSAAPIQAALRAPRHPGRQEGTILSVTSDGMARQLSDQSIFTAGESSRSRSRGTNQSSFSTDADGASSKTDGAGADGSSRASQPAHTLSTHLGAALERVEEEDHRATHYTPYSSANPAVNLFPEYPLYPIKSQNNSGEHDSSGSANYNGVASPDSDPSQHGQSGQLHQQENQMPSQAQASLRLPVQSQTPVQVPVRPAKEPEVPTLAIPLTAEALRARSLFEKRALIVDDSATNRKFVNRLLRTKIGLRDEAEDGQHAVDMVQAAMAEGAPYDVILMDYVMPVMDGPTATEVIRRSGFKGIILGVTGNGHQSEIDLFKNAGADRILVKPLSADQFYATLLEMLT